MPNAITPDTRPSAIASWLADAINVTDDSSSDYQLTDAYGVTYTGAPAHLALLALARRDLSPSLSADHPNYNKGFRRAAHTLIDWFTSPHTDPQHVAEFAALPPMRVCELVSYLFLRGHAMLDKVGPESLTHYTDHLLHHQVPDTDHPMPTVVDSSPRSLLSADDSLGVRLQITATASDGADEVAVPMEITASEDIFWEFTAAIPVPVAELNDLLLNLDIGDYLGGNRDLIEHHLIYRDSHTEQGLHVEARLARQGSAVDITGETVEVDLFFVGADQASALQTAPFGSRGLAAQHAADGDQIFVIEVEINTGAALIAVDTAP